MSIINDALKKVQANLTKIPTAPTPLTAGPAMLTAETSAATGTDTSAADDKPQPAQNTTNPSANAVHKRSDKPLIIICSIVCLGLAGLLTALIYIYNSSHEPVVVTTMTDITVNGIMTRDDNKKIVLINNQIYEVGDKINGMTIVDIAMDRVQLLKGSKTTTLLVTKH